MRDYVLYNYLYYNNIIIIIIGDARERYGDSKKLFHPPTLPKINAQLINRLVHFVVQNVYNAEARSHGRGPKITLFIHFPTTEESNGLVHRQ